MLFLAPLIAAVSVSASGWFAPVMSLGLLVMGFFWIPLIAAGISAIGGIAGQALANAGRKTQEELLQASMDEFGKIDPAKLEELVTQQLGPSAMATKTQTDPRLTGLQFEGLDQLSETINNGGLDPMARADLYRANAQAGRTAGANINRIQESMDSRGAGNSAAGAVLQAKAAQDASQQAHASGLDAAGMAWQRRMEALGQRTNQAGAMRQQEFGEKARRAEAEDSVARYNADARTAAGRYRNQMAQQTWENKFRTVDAKARAAGGAAEQAGRSADRTADMAAGIGNAAGQAVNQYGQDQRDTERMRWEAEQRQKDRDAWTVRPY